MMDKLVKSEVYRFLFENSNDALLLTNPDGHVYRANPAACESIQLNDQDVHMYGAGSLLKIPYQTKMNVKNLHTDTLELIIVKAPAPKN